MKAYTVFKIKGHDPVSGLHLTHKYFGEVSEIQIEEICKIINQYLISKTLKRPFGPFAEIFRFVEYFGAERLRVLRGPLRHRFCPNLRRSLNSIRQDEFIYKPHVTTPDLDPGVIFVFESYCLIVDKKVILEICF